MKNNSKTRKNQRRERARVGLIRRREMHQATVDDERTTEKTKELAAKHIVRIDRELEVIGAREMRGSADFKYFLDELV